MTRTFASIAAAAALLISGQAFAQATFITGQAPFDNGSQATQSSVQRAEVRLQAANNMPASGELTTHSVAEHQPSNKSRADVRQATLESLKSGDTPAVGENS